MKERSSCCYHKSIFVSQKCSKQYWGEAVLIAAHLINKLPTRVLNFKSSMETLTKFFPNLNVSTNLTPLIFGSVAFVHVHSQNMESLIHMVLNVSLLAIIPHKKGSNISIYQQEISLFLLMSPLLKKNHICKIPIFKGRHWVKIRKMIRSIWSSLVSPGVVSPSYLLGLVIPSYFLFHHQLVWLCRVPWSAYH